VTRPTSQSFLAIALTVFGGLAIGYGLITDGLVDREAWVITLAVVSIVAWVLRAVVGRLGMRRSELLLCVVAAFAGGLAAAPTNGIAVVPATLGVMAIVGQLERPLFLGLATALVTIGLVTIGALPVGTPVLSVVAMIGGVVLGVFGGISRRQFRQAEEQTHDLREQQLVVREERARIELLGQRQEVARDIHDVLAHSLGGLVIQLDAVEALLEAGDVTEAQRRVTDARRLAADGLHEARRAVGALRDPAATAAPEGTAPLVSEAAFAEVLDDLLAAHRSLGGVVEFSASGVQRPLGSAQAAALQRAFQEALSNARKHAPGSPVRVGVLWDDDRVTLTVSNPVHPESRQTALAATGGGHGLAGMRERFLSLPSGGSVETTLDGVRFVLTATAPYGNAPGASPTETEHS